MNKIAKSGAIVSIVGAAIVFIWGLIASVGVTSVSSMIGDLGKVIIVIYVVSILFAIAIIVLSSLVLAEKNTRIAAGIITILAIFFGIVFLFIPSVLFLIGAILLFCGKRKDDQIEQVEGNIKIMA